MFNSSNFWEDRYKFGGNSGAGSYDSSAEYKGKYVNQIIKKYNIKTINDYGHGDCNQLTYINGFEQYYGYDVSKSIREKCRQKYSSNPNIHFVDNVSDLPNADLSVSLDVIYHLVEDSVYEEYMGNLFSKSNVVLIYSTDYSKQNSAHVKHRNFTEYISNNFNNYKLIENDFSYSNEVGFFLYKTK